MSIVLQKSNQTNLFLDAVQGFARSCSDETGNATPGRVAKMPERDRPPVAAAPNGTRVSALNGFWLWNVLRTETVLAPLVIPSIGQHASSCVLIPDVLGLPGTLILPGGLNAA